MEVAGSTLLARIPLQELDSSRGLEECASAFEYVQVGERRTAFVVGAGNRESVVVLSLINPDHDPYVVHADSLYVGSLLGGEVGSHAYAGGYDVTLFGRLQARMRTSELVWDSEDPIELEPGKQLDVVITSAGRQRVTVSHRLTRRAPVSGLHFYGGDWRRALPNDATPLQELAFHQALAMDLRRAGIDLEPGVLREPGSPEETQPRCTLLMLNWEGEAAWLYSVDRGKLGPEELAFLDRGEGEVGLRDGALEVPEFTGEQLLSTDAHGRPTREIDGRFVEVCYFVHYG